MSLLPLNDENDMQRKADREADAMKAQLRKDVASWSAARNETSVRHEAERSVPVAKQPSPRPAAQARKSKAAAPAAAKPAAEAKKPFAMSYDGVTTAEHIKYMIANGAR